MRDLHKLVEAHPNEPAVAEWVKAVRTVYDDARAYRHESVFARRKQRRWFQKRLLELGAPIKEMPKAEPLVKPAKELVGKLDALEAIFHNPKAEVTDDILAMKGGAKLYSQLSMLYDFARDTYSPPTLPGRERHAELRQELDKLIAEYRGKLG